MGQAASQPKPTQAAIIFELNFTPCLKKKPRGLTTVFFHKKKESVDIYYTRVNPFFSPFLGHKKLLLSSPRSLPNTGLMMPTKGRHRRSRSSVMGASKLTHNMRSNRTFFSDTSLPEPICEPCSTSCSFYVSAEIFPCEDDGWWLLLTELVIAALSRCCITTIQPLPEEKLGCLKDAPDILEKEKPLARATCPHKVKLVKTFVVGKCD